MKKILSCAIFLSAMMGHISCSDDFEHFTLETPPDTMELTIVQEEIVLDEDLDDQAALTFTWNKAADRGKGTEITYFFKMDIANKSFETSIPKKEISSEQLSVSFTHKELNDLIITFWKEYPGSVVELEAEVIADVTTTPQFLKPEISTTIFKVTSYAPRPRDIYLLGSASNNEDPGNAIKLTTLTINKEYTWTGPLSTGTFCFIEEPGELLPAYNKGEGDNELVYRTLESDPGDMFTIETEGLYAIYVNTEDMAMTCTPIPYAEVYLVGNGCPIGWDIDNAIPLQWDYVRAAYVYEGELLEGEIKFPLWKNWSADSLMPPVNLARPGEDDTIALHPGGNPDHKWYIPEGGTYRMILDVNAMKISFEKL